MNTVSMKVNVPKSHEIMGNKKTEAPANYEQELDRVMLSSVPSCAEALIFAGRGAFVVGLACAVVLSGALFFLIVSDFITHSLQ